MSLMKSLLACLSIAVLMSSCNKDPNERYNEICQETLECSNDAGWAKDELHTELTGTYDWKFVRAYGFGEFYSDDAYLNWTLTLNEDSTYVLNMADTAAMSGTWQLQNSWMSFTLDCQPAASTVFGQVLYCPPYLMFYSSPVDGPDHLYKKQ